MKVTLITILTLIFIVTGCSTIKENKRTTIGAAAGTAIGAGAGAVLGDKRAAVIGGVIGGGLGAYAGSRMDKQAKELEKIAETKRTDEGLVTKLKSDITFDTGKATVKPDAKENLRQMAAIMKKYPENVLTIKGFTDSTGSEPLNDRLSEQRAASVEKELVKNGLPEKIIDIRGFGEDQPVAPNDTAEGRSQNRRVEIEIKVDESKLPKKKA